MVNEYLGETVVNIEDTTYKGYTKEQWIMAYIERYGQIDGSHHKQWVLDQIARIIKHTPIVITERKCKDGTSTYRFDTDKPSEEYLDWVDEMKQYDEECEEWLYSYYEGIAP
jgi:hypothetical protein